MTWAPVPIVSQDYTMVTKTGDANLYAVVKQNGIETQYTINSGSYAATSMLVKYDPSDETPSFVYSNLSGSNYVLNYLKLNSGNWVGKQVGIIGAYVEKDSIDFKYDPVDNLPACILFDGTNNDLNYYKYDGSSFVKTTILNGLVNNGNITQPKDTVKYANLNFDPADNYPVISYLQEQYSTVIETNPSLLRTYTYSIFKYAKYNGSSWTTETINTFNQKSVNNYTNIGDKKYINTKFIESTKEPLVLFGSTSTGLFANTRISNSWVSGAHDDLAGNLINAQPQIESYPTSDNDFYLSYILKNKSGLYVEGLGNLNIVLNKNYHGANPVLQEYTYPKYTLITGSGIDINKNTILKVDSDLNPIVFYKKDNIIKYSKYTGHNFGNTQNFSYQGNYTQGFSSENIFKNLNNSNSYEFGFDFLTKAFKAYLIYGMTFQEYKYPYRSVSTQTIDPIYRTIYSASIAINPTTKKPNIVLGVGGQYGMDIKYYYQTNNQGTAWTGLTLPSGNLYFSGKNFPCLLTSATQSVRFDFDKNTNQVLVHAPAYGSGNINGSFYGSFIFKKDLVGSGYTYYNTPYSGYAYGATDFKVNPITNQYCLIFANEDQGSTPDRGLTYCEMNPNTNTWIKTNIEPTVKQMSNIDLDFKSNGYPITAYTTASGVTGFVKIAEYNGSNWTTTTIWTGRYGSIDLFNTDFKYNSGEGYYGFSFIDATNYFPNRSGMYITNKGGTIKKYSYNYSGSNSLVNRLFFKKYKGETMPFIFKSTNTTDALHYADFIYLENENFVTGKFTSNPQRDYNKFDIILV